jgi:hypothetical protein
MKITRSELLALTLVEIKEGHYGAQLRRHPLETYAEVDVSVAISFFNKYHRQSNISILDTYEYEDKFAIIDILIFDRDARDAYYESLNQ